MDALAEGLAGGVGGIVSAVALYPLEAVKSKMQSQTREQGSVRDDTVISCARRVWKTRGLAGFYSGVQFSALSSFVEKLLYFAAYSNMRHAAVQVLGLKSVRELGVLQNLAIGAVADWSHLPATLPIETVTVRLHADETGSLTAGAIVRDVLNGPTGWRAFYRSIYAHVVLCMRPAITYAIFERVKTILLTRRPRKGSHLSALEAFNVAAVARALTTILVFPYTRAKTLLQSARKVAGHENDSVLDMIVATAKSEGGFGALYRGLPAALLRGVLAAALMLACKERIESTIRRALVRA